MGTRVWERENILLKVVQSSCKTRKWTWTSEAVSQHLRAGRTPSCQGESKLWKANPSHLDGSLVTEYYEMALILDTMVQTVPTLK